MSRYEVDAIIIGSGQGGVPLAEKLSKAGQNVAIFERGPWGGCCLNYGCTPSKMFLASAHAAAEAHSADELGIRAQVEVDFKAVMDRIRSVKKQWSSGVRTRLEEQGVKTIHKEARFAAPNMVTDGEDVYESKIIVINTGKSPLIPPIEGLPGIPYLTYESFWNLENLPNRTIIVGGGYVGIELGQGLAQLGSQVHIVEANPRLISREEEDLSRILQEQLKEDGVQFHFDTRAEQVSYEDHTFNVRLSEGESVEAECLLIATGRKPNTEKLEAAKGKVELTESAHISVGDQFKTSAEGVYAIGDVTGQPAFTHVAWEDHRRLMAILNGEDRTQGDRVLAYAFFTRPQVGRAGLTLSQAKEQGYNAQQKTLKLEQVARASEVGYTKGFYRMVIDQDTDKILGATLVSPAAAELIHVFITLIEADATWQDLDQAAHIHPTFAEGLPSLARLFK